MIGARVLLLHERSLAFSRLQVQVGNYMMVETITVPLDAQNHPTTTPKKTVMRLFAAWNSNSTRI
jgi:hypothetical protein